MLQARPSRSCNPLLVSMDKRAISSRRRCARGCMSVGINAVITDAWRAWLTKLREYGSHCSWGLHRGWTRPKSFRRARHAASLVAERLWVAVCSHMTLWCICRIKCDTLGSWKDKRIKPSAGRIVMELLPLDEFGAACCCAVLYSNHCLQYHHSISTVASGSHQTGIS